MQSQLMSVKRIPKIQDTDSNISKASPNSYSNMRKRLGDAIVVTMLVLLVAITITHIVNPGYTAGGLASMFVVAGIVVLLALLVTLLVMVTRDLATKSTDIQA